MADKIASRTLSGFRDFLPDELAIRKKVISIFTEIFEKYGFVPLETPALEYQDILLGKYGEDAEKLMYLFQDPGKRSVGMKYDLTVPLARVIGQYSQISKPFKRYQIQPVWRADKPQKGRYREITQCDIDTVGISSPLADAEIVAISFEVFKKVGFKEFTIRINSRQTLFGIMEKSGIQKKDYLNVIRSIDKLDKKSPDEVKNELSKKGFTSEVISQIFNNLKDSTPDQNLKQVIEFVSKLGVDKDYYSFDQTLARGLDYYTGPIFETVVTEPKIGSISGGGRYDELLSLFLGQPIPATGTTIGLDRTIDVIMEQGLWKSVPRYTTQTLVTVFSSNLLNQSLEIVKMLRKQNIKAEIYLDPESKLDKQLKYADKKGIPYVVIIGPEEVKKNVVKLKNMKTGEQKELDFRGLLADLRRS